MVQLPFHVFSIISNKFAAKKSKDEKNISAFLSVLPMT